MALARLRCWERSSCIITTMPVGRCVRRMADSVLLTCWPPAPPARSVSTLRSPSLIVTSTSSASGSTATAAPPDLGDDFLVATRASLARRNHLDLPAVLRGKALIHPEQIAGEQRGLVA